VRRGGGSTQGRMSWGDCIHAKRSARGPGGRYGSYASWSVCQRAVKRTAGLPDQLPGLTRGNRPGGQQREQRIPPAASTGSLPARLPLPKDHLAAPRGLYNQQGIRGNSQLAARPLASHRPAPPLFDGAAPAVLLPTCLGSALRALLGPRPGPLFWGHFEGLLSICSKWVVLTAPPTAYIYQHPQPPLHGIDYHT
jgi:hypothetical protein